MKLDHGIVKGDFNQYGKLGLELRQLLEEIKQLIFPQSVDILQK